MEEEARQQRSKKRPLLQQGSTNEEKASPVKRTAASAEEEDDRKPAARGKRDLGGPQKQSRAKKRSSDQLNFPEKLMQLINENVAPEHVTWIENEEAISFKTDGFQENVLDKHFQGLKYDSFVRKLNRWGFRRVTSEGIAPGTVAYYHNSFRKQEQELLKTMGIGKKNDPEVRDLQAFGGEQSTSAAIAAAGKPHASSGVGLSGAASALRLGQGGLSGVPYAPAHLDQHFLHTVASRQHPTGVEQVGGVATALHSAASRPATSRQESKAEVAAGGALGMDTQQLLLEAMLARQRQTDVAAMHEREAALMAESILLRQSQQQQRANAAISAALANVRDDDLALKLAAFAAQSSSTLGQPQQSLRQQQQQQQSSIPEYDSRLTSESALELLFRQRLQSTDPSAGLGLANIPANLLSPGSVAASVNLRGNLNPNIQGNINPLANAAANVNTEGNTDLERLWRALLQNRQRDARGRGQGPGSGPGQGPQR